MKLSAQNSTQPPVGNSQQENQSIPEEIMKKHLSKREIQVLQLVAKGMTATQVAEKLYVSLDTVETHKKNIIIKFKAKNTVEAVVKAVRMQMI